MIATFEQVELKHAYFKIVITINHLQYEIIPSSSNFLV